MKLAILEDGKISIQGDEWLLEKLLDNDFSAVDISDYPINADSLYQLYNLASSCRVSEVYDNSTGLRVLVKTHDNIKRYAVMKQKYIEMYSR
jgi:hypothetical protein